MNNERLQIAIPKGELQRDVEKFMGFSGLEFTPFDRSWKVPVANMPIDFVIVRASDIPSIVKSERSNTAVGITGSDILWEAGYGQKYGEEIPIYQAIPDARQSSLYIGATEEFIQGLNVDVPDPSDLEGQMIATKHPSITRDYFVGKGLNSVEIITVNGNDEAMQYVYEFCKGILGIISSGRTIAANGIRTLDVFYDVTVRMIEEQGKMTKLATDILDDFREKIVVALQRERMVS